MTEHRRASGDEPVAGGDDERRDWCHVYNAGEGIVEVVADFASHYDARPNQPWKPKGTTVEQIVAEVDIMTMAFNRAIDNARRKIAFVMER